MAYSYYNSNNNSNKGDGGKRNVKLQRFIFKLSAFSSLACFLTLFVGWVNNNQLASVVVNKEGEFSQTLIVYYLVMISRILKP